MRSEIIQAEEGEPVWETYSSVIDEAMARLGEVERSAVALRYLRGMSLQEVGQAMGLSEEAARKRVERGLAKLRGLMASKMAVPSVAGLAVAITANGVQAAPAGVVQSISVIAVSGGSSASVVLAKGVIKMMWEKTQFSAPFTVVK